MSRSNFLCIFFATILSTANCASIPSAFIKEVILKSVDKNGITFLVRIGINNPFEIDVPAPAVEYFIKSDDMDLATGKVPDPGALKGKKVTILNMTINVPSTILISLIKDIGRDWDIDYEIGMKITADFPVIRNFTIPIGYKGTLNLPSWQLLLH